MTLFANSCRQLTHKHVIYCLPHLGTIVTPGECCHTSWQSQGTVHTQLGWPSPGTVHTQLSWQSQRTEHTQLSWPSLGTVHTQLSWPHISLCPREQVFLVLSQEVDENTPVPLAAENVLIEARLYQLPVDSDKSVMYPTLLAPQQVPSSPPRPGNIPLPLLPILLTSLPIHHILSSISTIPPHLGNILSFPPYTAHSFSPPFSVKHILSLPPTLYSIFLLFLPTLYSIFLLFLPSLYRAFLLFPISGKYLLPAFPPQHIPSFLLTSTTSSFSSSPSY